MSAVFGGGQQYFVLLLVFIALAALVVLTFWFMRRYLGGRRESAKPRGRRSSRIAVVDAAIVDARRRLILIRRDHVEHLLLVGGAADVVVEPNIVRAAVAARELSRPSTGGDTVPEPVPIPHATMRPLNQGRAVRTEPNQPPEPATRRPRSVPPPIEQRPDWVESEAPPLPSPPLRERRIAPEALAGLAEEPTGAPRSSETDTTAAPPPPARPHVSRARPQPVTAAPPIGEAKASTSSDSDLAEMAQRLEAALGRPRRGDESRADTETSDTVDHETETHAPTPQTGQPAAMEPSKAARRDASAARRERRPVKSIYDSLEQELAGLLGPGTAAGSTRPRLDNADEDRTDGGDTRSD
jgi:flagellar protein FliO/FliZ